MYINPSFSTVPPYTGQYDARILYLAHTDIHASSGIRTHDLNIREGEVSSYLRPRGHRDRRRSLSVTNLDYDFFLFLFLTKRKNTC
jgi:hypothetical protein